MKETTNKPFYEDLETWAMANGHSAHDIIQRALDDFYERTLHDVRLTRFFAGANLEAIRKHQSVFATRVFCEDEMHGAADKYLHGIYARLFRYKKIKTIHFDYFCENFISAIQGAGVISRIVDEVAARLVPLRELFDKATSRYALDREERLFFALDNDGDGLVPEPHIRQALRVAGLPETDVRLQKLHEKLDENRGQLLDFKSFNQIVRSSELLVERTLQGGLVIPDFMEFSQRLDDIFDDVKKNDTGKLATYIPPLADANPEQFGVAVVTIDGQVYVRGNHDVGFSVQSMCKPFNYCLAMEELGEEKVHEHVGNEPSGRAFNDRDLMVHHASNVPEGDAGQIEIPYNPMINAGAIMTAALIKSGEKFSSRFSHVRHQWARMIGNTAGLRTGDDIPEELLPRFNKETARQENFTGFNNIAMGYLLMATGKLPYNSQKIPADPDPDNPNDFEFIHRPAVAEALKFYFSTCSMELTAKDMATAAATLANAGVCPMTQERVLQQRTVRNCLSVTQMCGMYDGSGDFFYNIGLPAKSGVGGGVMLVVPKLMGICIFSPRLDRQGNSVRGVQFAKKMVQKCRLHLYDGVMTDRERIDPRLPLARWRASQVAEAGWAAHTGDVRTLFRLHEEQHDLSRGDYDQRTPMHLAAAEGHIDVINFLLKKGVEPKPDRWGAYPINDAMECKHSSVVKMFTKQGAVAAKPYHFVEDMDGPEDSAANYADPLAVAELLWAATENNILGLRRLVAQGVPVAAQDYDLRTPLHLAAAEGHLKAVKYLIAHGHPLNVRDRWQATPLDEARREKRRKIIKYLKKKIKRAQPLSK